MKRIIVLVILSLTMSWGCKAQDTITVLDMQQYTRYGLSPTWPNFPNDYDTTDDGKEYTGHLTMCALRPDPFDVEAHYMYSEEPVTVYGVAAALDNYNRYIEEIFEGIDYIDFGDTSSENSFAWLMLYEAESDSLRQLVDTAPMYVHTMQHPEYYLQFDLWDWAYGFGDSRRKVQVVPMYERYFPAPIEVVDSFYVGYINRGKDRHLGEYADLLTFRLSVSIHNDLMKEKVAYFMNTEYHHGWYYNNFYVTHYLVFPIIAPPDTTSWGSDSTLTMQTDNMVYRYTNVSPNPATSKVRISSSFGITAIEAFNASGACVYSSKHDGLAVSIDVSSWPSGTYLLHITTRNGTTVKKLVVH